MTFDLDKVGKAIDLAIKAEVHAFGLLLVGAGLSLHGMKEEGNAIILAAMAIFRGGPKAP